MNALPLLERKLSILKHMCEEIGRDYESIKRTALLNCSIAETDEAALAKLGSIERDAGQTHPDHIRERALVGTPKLFASVSGYTSRQEFRKLFMALRNAALEGAQASQKSSKQGC